MANIKKPRGRPRKTDKATGRFEIRCKPEEKAFWEEAARREGKKLSAWIKVLANRAANGKGNKETSD